MVEVNELSACPACSSTNLLPAFAQETRRHNSVTRLADPTPPGVDPAIVKAFDKINWKICKNCGLIFAGRRPPSGNSIDSWYLTLFKISEERGYDVFPLPKAYVQSKAKSNAALLDLIMQHHSMAKGTRLLHVRCSTGELLKLAREKLDADAWGLDFFPSCVQHANAILGGDRVAQMRGPEPMNPFPQKTFDVIIANHMTTHSHDPAALMANFRKWLADDGVLIVHNEPDHQLTLKSFNAYSRGINFFHKQLFTEDTFISSLRSWGFEPTRIRGLGADARKLNKNMMFICRKRQPAKPENTGPQKSIALLKSWQFRRRIGDLLQLVRK